MDKLSTIDKYVDMKLREKNLILTNTNVFCFPGILIFRQMVERTTKIFVQLEQFFGLRKI